MISRGWIGLAGALMLVIATGCSELHYYAQSAHGQLDIVERREPIAAVIADTERDAQLRERLSAVLRMRAFAVDELGLPASGSYTRYADLERDYAVLALYAAPEFSVVLHTWCYPVVGCAAYRGYFDRDMLLADSEALQQQGFETYVARVPAYSTLGWFDDPVLNTVLDWPEAQLAGLIFHELSHQKLYIKGDTVFNESFATAIEQVGVERWLRLHAEPAAIEAYRARRARHEQVVALVARVRDDLQRLYDEDRPPAQMRRAKAARLARAVDEYRALRARWGVAQSGYDTWFDATLNNARLGALQAYHGYVAAFLRMLAAEGDSLQRFYALAGRIGALPESERRQCLDDYAAQRARPCTALMEN